MHQSKLYNWNVVTLESSSSACVSSNLSTDMLVAVTQLKDNMVAF